MKKKKPNYYKEIIEVLLELKSLYPSYSMGNHFSTALDDYPDTWGISDKELLYTLTKYKAKMQMDVPHETDEEDIQKIIEEGMNLKGISSLEEEEEI